MATVLRCDSCDGPVSRYSTSGMCSSCEVEETDLYVRQCKKDIEDNVPIRYRIYTVLPNLCFNCMKPLPITEESDGRVRAGKRKFCDRHCQYEYRKKNGVDKNAR